MDIKTYKEAKWLAVYGASVAAQCHQHYLDGRGGVTPDAMERIQEEAKAVADLEAETHPIMLPEFME